MTRSRLLRAPAALTAAVLVAAALVALAVPASATTLDDVKARGILVCGVNTPLAGFGARDASDHWAGFDVDLCHALAAAVLGEPSRVRYVATLGEEGFAALAAGDIDVLVRGALWSFRHDAEEDFDFAAVSYYDSQGFMVRKDLGVSSAKELDGITICVQAGGAAEQNLKGFFRVNNLGSTALEVADEAEAQRLYLAGNCEAYSASVSTLAATRATMAGGDAHTILPETISKEPLGPAVRHGDDQWEDIVRWTIHALLIAEEKGITRANIDEVATSSADPDTRRLLGLEGNVGAGFGLDDGWARRAIAASGNYGEIFEANIGAATPIGLPRGLNALWTQGGLHYPPPMR